MRALLVLLALPFAGAAHGAAALDAVGIVPAEMAPPPLLRGESYVFHFALQNTHATSRAATLRLDGPAAPWARLDATRVAVPAGGEAPVLLRLAVPADAAPGAHEIRLVATFDAGSAPAGSGVAIAPAIASRLLLSVTGEVTRDLRLVGLEVPDAEEGHPAVATVRWENRGNVRERPAGELEVRLASTGALLATIPVPASEVGPLGVAAVAVPLPDLPRGAYEARLLAEGAAAATRFKVVEPGALAKDAILRGLAHPPTIPAGETLRVVARIANVGDAAIARAVVELELLAGGAVVRHAASEPVRLLPGEEAEVALHVVPEAAGAHRLRAVLAYDGWRSEPSESLLSVAAAPAGEPPFLALVAVGGGLLGLGGYLLGRRGGRKA